MLADSAGRVRILSGGRRLQISVAEKADAGLYTCMASNVAGIAKKDYNLQVYSKLLTSTISRHDFLLKIPIFTFHLSLDLKGSFTVVQLYLSCGINCADIIREQLLPSGNYLLSNTAVHPCHPTSNTYIKVVAIC